MPQNGTVKFFNSKRGYGFITPDEGEKDIFVHVTALEGSGIQTLEDGAKVTFETEDDPKGRGLQAVKIQLA